MNIKTKFTLLLILLMTFTSFFAMADEDEGNEKSAKGKISGTVIEDATNETLIGATVQILGTSNGAITDLDGSFTIDNLKPGTYNIKITYVSFQDIVIHDIQVKPKDVTILNGLRMKEESQQLDEVVITAEAVRSNEISLITIRKNSQMMIDGISSAKMSLIGDATAVDAVKRVTGVSVEGGKYFYVRGLGDRYSKSVLNGVDIPGLDPDRNTLQLDIFPTNLISNITVSKNFTADLPADFTGGLLNIETVEFPESKIFNISLGTSYNPDMHFNSDYVTYEGGDLDFLGFDDGTRALPDDAKYFNENFQLNNRNDFTKRFTSHLGVTNETSLMDFSGSISIGDKLSVGKGKNKLGYVFSASYSNGTDFYDDVYYGYYQKEIDNHVNKLVLADQRTGKKGINQVLVGLLGGVAYKTTESKYKFTFMHLQKGESEANDFFRENKVVVGQSGFDAYQNVLKYNQSSLSNILLSGHHALKNNWKLDWKLSPTLSTSEDPDIRSTSIEKLDNNNYSFTVNASANPPRIWRSLSEVNVTSKIDISKKYMLFDQKAIFRFGPSFTYKYRDYNIIKHTINFDGNKDFDYLPNFDILLDDSNIYPNGMNSFITGGLNRNDANEYQSNSTNFAGYVSNEFNLLPNLKTILGVRAEYFVQRHTGRDIAWSSGDTTNGRNLDNEKVLDDFDLFPSANFIFNYAKENNIRASYTRTIARPSFKETSFAQIMDPVSGIFNGALIPIKNTDGTFDWDGDIKSTYIHNIDLRWEMFMELGQVVSLSGFYKSFKDPIEIVRLHANQTGFEVQPRNVGNANLYGAEFEFVKSLGFISPILEKLSVNGNFTYVYSEVDMTDEEYGIRQDYARDGEEIDDTRDMAGQSPYIINAGMVYTDRDQGIDAGIFYNVKGKTLAIVDGGLSPDIYTKEFHALNFSFSKKVGVKQNMSIKLKVSNILGEKKEMIYSAYEADDEFYSLLDPGRSFSLGFSYKF